MGMTEEARKFRCCGMNLNEPFNWDGFELYDDSDDSGDPDNACPNQAGFFYDNGLERIPLCAAHYAWWCCPVFRGGPEPGDGTSPIWSLAVTLVVN